MQKMDVVVIGAGPAGSVTAKGLAEAGFEVLLVEKDVFPGKTNVCAGGVSKSLLNELNLSNSVIEKKTLGFVHYFPWGKVENVGSRFVSYTVYRRVFDRFLAQQAEKSGAKLLNFTKVYDVVKNRDRTVVFMRNRESGEEAKVESKMVVFADGPNTLAHKKFPWLGVDGKPERTSLAVIYEIEWPDNPLDYKEIYYDLRVSPFGYGWIFPKKDILNVGTGCLISHLKGSIKGYLDFLVKKHPIASKKLQGKKIVRYAAGLIPSAPAKRIFGESMLVVGDAAGMVHPISGAGIGYAVHGGKIAARMAIKALSKKDFSARFLSQYQREWERSDDYKFIKMAFLRMNTFLKLSYVDKNAYLKLENLEKGRYGPLSPWRLYWMLYRRFNSLHSKEWRY